MSAPAQALVVVDMRCGLLAGPQAVVGAAALTDRIETLIGRATAAGALVVQLQNDGAPGQPDEPDGPGWELALSGGTAVRKSTDDGFAGTPLGALLAMRSVRAFAITGRAGRRRPDAVASSDRAAGICCRWRN